MSVPTAHSPAPPAIERRRRTGDRLTGLADRDTFARAVDQADRDRDRLLVAVVTVDGLAEVNRLCGYDAGDDLLGALGRVLAPWASVDVTVGRIGGSHLGLLRAPAPSQHPADLVGPILDDLDRAVERWLEHRAALGTPCPILPRARTGMAAGHGGGTWSDAEVALAVAQADPDGPSAVHFDLSDPRLAAHRRRQVLADEVADALLHHRLPVDRTVVEPIDTTGGAGSGVGGWFRLRARPGLGTPPTGRPVAGPAELVAADLALAPGLAGQVDRHVLARAAEDIDRSTAGSPPATSVPLLGPIDGPLSALTGPVGRAAGRPERSPGPVVVEIDQATLATVEPSVLARRLDELGWRLAITDVDGGWTALALVEELPVHHLRPRPDLLRRAASGQGTPATLVTTLGAAAADHDIGLVAGSWADHHRPDRSAVDRLRELGLTHLDRTGR